MKNTTFYNIIELLIMSFTFLVALTLFGVIAILVIASVPAVLLMLYVIDNILPKFIHKEGNNGKNNVSNGTAQENN